MEYWEIGAVILSMVFGVSLVNWLWNAVEDEIDDELSDYWKDGRK